MQVRVTVLQWVEGLCEEQVFTGDERIASPLFANLDLMVKQVLQGG